MRLESAQACPAAQRGCALAHGGRAPALPGRAKEARPLRKSAETSPSVLGRGEQGACRSAEAQGDQEAGAPFRRVAQARPRGVPRLAEEPRMVALRTASLGRMISGIPVRPPADPAALRPTNGALHRRLRSFK